MRGNERTMRDKMIELVDKAKEEYFNDVTDHTETEYIVECLLNYGIVLDQPRKAVANNGKLV